jgi:hypothetical protein
LCLVSCVCGCSVLPLESVRECELIVLIVCDGLVRRLVAIVVELFV